jgi:deoxyribonuclease-4
MLIGAHVSSSGGLVKALERAEDMGCETMQIFNQSPRAWRPTKYKAEDIEAFRSRFAESLVESLFIHAVYLINVASDDAEVRRKSREALTHALLFGDAVGAAGVIIHPGSGKGSSPAKTFGFIGGAIKRALSVTERCPLLLENTAGAGFTVGRHFDELAEVMGRVDGGERLGVCLDSCHLLASGHEVREPDALASVLDDYERKLGLGCLHCVHLNDSMTPLGSNVDRHATLGQGELGDDGLRVFLGEPRFKELPVLLETGREGHAPEKEHIDLAKRLRDEAQKLRRPVARARAGRTRGNSRGRSRSRRKSAG